MFTIPDFLNNRLHWTDVPRRLGLTASQSPSQDITVVVYNGIGFLVFGHVIDLLMIMVNMTHKQKCINRKIQK